MFAHSFLAYIRAYVRRSRDLRKRAPPAGQLTILKMYAIRVRSLLIELLFLHVGYAPGCEVRR
jgi:hypothetical protein